MSIFNTVFAKNLQLHQMEMQRLQQQEQQRKMEQQQQTQLLMEQQARADQRRDAEFNRHLKVAELQGKFLGMLGQQAPEFTNPALQEFAEANYLGGMAARESDLRNLGAQYDLRGIQDAAAMDRAQLRAGTQQDIAGARLSFQQGKHGDDMDWKRRAFLQGQMQHDDRMKLGWANHNKPRSNTSIILNNNPFFKAETDLRKELEGRKESKNYHEVATQVSKIENATDDGVGDMGLIFAYMKMLDPDSVVRETEYKAAENVRGRFDSAWNLWRRLASGEKLTPTQRANFKREAKMLFNQHKSAYDALAGNYRRVAESVGANPANVVFDATGAPSVSIEDEDELEEPF